MFLAIATYAPVRAEGLLQATLDKKCTLLHMLLPCLPLLCNRLFQPLFVRSALGRGEVNVIASLALLVVDDPDIFPVECIDLLPKLVALRLPELTLKTVIALYLRQIDQLRPSLPGDQVAEPVYFFQ